MRLDLRHVHPLSRAFVAAGVEIGLVDNKDFNGASQEGIGFFQVTQRRRGSSQHRGRVPEAGTMRNLTVLTGRIPRACSSRKGGRWAWNTAAPALAQARAAREVLLCGGGVNSPQLLLLSGVGPAAHLKSLGISVIADSAGVGQNLQDHLIVPVAFECTQPISLAAADTLLNLLKYLLLRRGPFTSNVGEAGAFARTRPDLPEADVQLHFGPAYYLDHGFVQPDGHGFTIGPMLIRPRSRGSITLVDRDPLHAPHIEPNYLAAAEDLQVLVDGVKLARRWPAPERCPLSRSGVLPWASGQQQRGDRRVYPAELADGLPSGGDMPYGSARIVSRRSAVAGARRAGIACRRCRGDALDRRRQHECPCDHDRGESGRSDS